MTSRGDEERRRAATGGPLLRPISCPLGHIAEEHWRQRAMLTALEALARSAEADRASAGAILTQLREELPIHMLDEDEDLLPLLRRRAEPEDEVERFISRLGADHAACAARITAVQDALAALSTRGAPLDDAARALILEHAQAERRHLIFENAVVLPLARARLTANDKRTLALRMAARRGYCLLAKPGAPLQAEARHA